MLIQRFGGLLLKPVMTIYLLPLPDRKQCWEIQLLQCIPRWVLSLHRSVFLSCMLWPFCTVIWTLGGFLFICILQNWKEKLCMFLFGIIALEADWEHHLSYMGKKILQDERYAKYVGKMAVVPLSEGRQIPIIADEVHRTGKSHHNTHLWH